MAEKTAAPMVENLAATMAARKVAPMVEKTAEKLAADLAVQRVVWKVDNWVVYLVEWRAA